MVIFQERRWKKLVSLPILLYSVCWNICLFLHKFIHYFKMFFSSFFSAITIFFLYYWSFISRPWICKWFCFCCCLFLSKVKVICSFIESWLFFFVFQCVCRLSFSLAIIGQFFEKFVCIQCKLWMDSIWNGQNDILDLLT